MGIDETRRRQAEAVVFRIEEVLLDERRRSGEALLAAARERGYADYARRVELSFEVEDEIIDELKRRYLIRAEPTS